MISKEISALQQAHTRISGAATSTNIWSRGLVVKLLEATHKQCLYRNVLVHDSIMGVDATLRKEELQKLISWPPREGANLMRAFVFCFLQLGL